MAIFGQDRPNIGGGWAALGQILGGGQGVSQAAYSDQLGRNYRAMGAKADWEIANEEAGRARERRIVESQLGGTFEKLGMNPALADILRASEGGNADAYAQALLRAQEFGSRQGAREAALGGDLGAANANLFGVASGPVDTTKIAGGMVYNPLGTPDQTMTVTPLGQSEIDYDRARIAKTAATGGGGALGGGKAPSGYMWAGEGQLAPIPGGPADPSVGATMTPAQRMKMEQAQRKERLMLDAYSSQSDQTIGLVDELLARRGDFGGVTGMGALGAYIPGTDYADVRAKLETLKAQSAFGALQEMRANSPTGGALGSVTERELALLQNAETQLQNYQSPAALAAALEAYKRSLVDGRNRMRGGVDEFYAPIGAAEPLGAAPSAPASRPLRYNPATGDFE